jgi:hypothetical protein
MNFRSGYLSDVAIIDVINWVVLTFGLIGLQGYVYKIKYFNEQFWKLFFPTFFLWALAYLVWLWSAISPENQTVMVASIYAVIFILSVPQLIALYRYGVKNT